MIRYDPPVSRCPSCLTTRNGPGPCAACGWGTAMPKYRPERSGVPLQPSPPLRGKDGVHTDIGRLLDRDPSTLIEN